jgi:predicted RNA binding protein YcfA (HicA-like mRNA interferase family)
VSERKEVQKLLRRVQSSGFTVTRAGSGHWLVRNPEQPGVVTVSFSPRAFNPRGIMRELKKIGYKG